MFFGLIGHQRLPRNLAWLNRAKPSQSLEQTAHYFIDLVTEAQYKVLQETCSSLSATGREIIVGTTCSGLETGGLALENLFNALNARFGTSVRVKVAFAAELAED